MLKYSRVPEKTNGKSAIPYGLFNNFPRAPLRIPEIQKKGLADHGTQVPPKRAERSRIRFHSRMIAHPCDIFYRPPAAGKASAGEDTDGGDENGGAASAEDGLTMMTRSGSSGRFRWRWSGRNPPLLQTTTAAMQSS